LDSLDYVEDRERRGRRGGVREGTGEGLRVELRRNRDSYLSTGVGHESYFGYVRT
jgi:hypothetical protein